MGCKFFCFFVFLLEMIPDKSTDSQWQRRSPEEPLSSKLNNCLAQLSTNWPLLLCWPTWFVWPREVWADDYRQTGYQLCLLGRGDVRWLSANSLFFPRTSETKRRSARKVLSSVIFTDDLFFFSESVCACALVPPKLTRLVNLDRGYRGPSNVMTGSRCERAGFKMLPSGSLGIQLENRPSYHPNETAEKWNLWRDNDAGGFQTILPLHRIF